MSSSPLPPARPLKAQEPVHDASEKVTSQPNIDTEKQSQQASQNQVQNPLSLLETSAIVFDNVAMRAKYEKEQLEDAKFQKELTDRLFSFILQFQSWSSARPSAEFQSRTTGIQQRFEEILEREKAQELIRQNFGNFLDMVRMALVVMGNGQA